MYLLPKVQPGTKWNNGLTEKEICVFENKLGFSLPLEYRVFLNTMNGFDTAQICINSERKDKNIYEQAYYKYPRDLKTQTKLQLEIDRYQKNAYKVLSESGFDTDNIVGFIPTYAHRALVVFNDKSLSPVISVWGDDIVLLADDLIKYWILELDMEDYYIRSL